MKLPTLYKKTNTGAIQFWSVSVDTDLVDLSLKPGTSKITVQYGQLDTDSPQETFDIIEHGKNVGKKNETTAYEQAELEAKSKWEKQLKKGYVKTIEEAREGKIDTIIEGGISPMLAHRFDEHGHKIKYSCYGQPKLDGHRIIAVVKEGRCTLWSRTQKPINSLPHIVDAIEKMVGSTSCILDGEGYSHDFKENFEKISSLIRQENPAPDCHLVQYHIYDMPSANVPFEERLKAIKSLPWAQNPGCLVMVDTVLLNNQDEATEFFLKCLNDGYEGAILRNKAGMYVNKRSYDLQKVKTMKDDEFDIVGIEEGKGRLIGHVGSFICSMPNGKTFLAKMSGSTDKLREYFVNHRLWENKRLTVQYQGLTAKEGVPRFPVGIRIREEED